MEFIIGEKKYKARASLADVQKSYNKYPGDGLKLYDPTYQKWLLKSIKRFINNAYIFPRFFFVRSIEKRIGVKEYAQIDTAFSKVLAGEDPDSKNE